MNPKKIDKLFLKERKKQPSFPSSLETLNEPLDNILSYINGTIEPIERDNSRLYNLNGQIASLINKNREITTILRNKEKLYQFILDLLKKIEIKEEHYRELENIQIRESTIERIEFLLSIIKPLKNDLNLKCTQERNSSVKTALSSFKRKKKIWWTEFLNNFLTEDKLNIHTKIFEAVERYQVLIDESMFESYIAKIKHIYFDELRNHLNYFSGLKNVKLNKKSIVNLKILFESLCLIVKTECNFIKKYFIREKFYHQVLFFNELYNLFLLFLNELYRHRDLLVLLAMESFDLKEDSNGSKDDGVKILNQFKEMVAKERVKCRQTASKKFREKIDYAKLILFLNFKEGPSKYTDDLKEYYCENILSYKEGKSREEIYIRRLEYLFKLNREHKNMNILLMKFQKLIYEKISRGEDLADIEQLSSKVDSNELSEMLIAMINNIKKDK